MILSREKTEEYREIKPYWTIRFQNKDFMQCPVRFRNGYRSNSPYIDAQIEISVGVGRPEWGAEPNKKYYVLRILKLL